MKKFAVSTRRQFLRASGFTIALPLFGSLMPARAFSQALSQRKIIYIYMPNGVLPGTFHVSGDNNKMNFPPLLARAGFGDFQNDLTVVRGLFNYFATTEKDAFGNPFLGVDRDGKPRPAGGGQHERSTPAWLTGARPDRLTTSETQGTYMHVGQSVDVALANHLKTTSVAFTREGDPYVDWGYSPTYNYALSWLNADQPNNYRTTPRGLFDYIFSGPGATTNQTPTQAAPLANSPMALKKRIFDAAMGDINDLKKVLGKEDDMKLEDYFSSLEAALPAVAEPNGAAAGPGAPQVTAPIANIAANGSCPANREMPNTGLGTDIPRVTDAFFKVLNLALRCGRIQVGAYTMDFETNASMFPGVSENHHKFSHYNDDAPVLRPMMEKVTLWYATQFANFIKKLRADDPTILDSTLITFGSGLEDSHSHSPYDLPTFLVGRGAGILKSSGRVVNLPKGTPIANMHLEIMRRAGINRDRFGNSNNGISTL